jgi:uncharacterized protein (TIGR02646 family)
VIRIYRPSTGPEVLLTEGDVRRREHEAAIDADRATFISGAVSLQFDRAVYADQSVKETLVAMQHSKCAFCEAKPLHVSDGDVEHFRPKAAVRQSDAESLERPGYYWLAYAWENLLFACERCNRRHKKNLFPLIAPAHRATSHRAPIADEMPVFIDPSMEDPEQYITYREHVPVAVDGNARGEQTIEALGLRRPHLNADRERQLANLKILHAVVSLPEVPDSLRNESLALLKKYIASDGEYSLLSRIAVKALGGIA